MRRTTKCHAMTSMLSYMAFASLLFGCKLFLIHAYGNATPYWDQWDAEADFLYRPFLEGTLRWDSLFSLHNEHRIFTTRVLALFLLKINGIWNPLLQMVVNALLHIFALCSFIFLLTRVIGNRYLPALLIFSLMLFGLPYAWENTLAGFQSQFYFLLIFSFLCMWFSVTKIPLSPAWWVGYGCGILASLSLASGIFALASSAIVGLVFFITEERKTRNQLIAVAILSGTFVLGAVMTPSLAYHASLKATSFHQFCEALIAVTAWPFSLGSKLLTLRGFLSAVIRNIPALYYVGYMLYRHPRPDDRRWFLVALAVWSLGQAVSISAGRAVGNLSSRYLDLYALSVLANFSCLISIANSDLGRAARWVKLFFVIWSVGVIVITFDYVENSSIAGLVEKRDSGVAQEYYTRQYLATGDSSYLVGKPFLHVPYPKSDRLETILSSAVIQSILPTNIRPKLSASRIDVEPIGSFVQDGFYPTTEKPRGTSIGSYGEHGDAEIGHAEIYYNENGRRGYVEIPIAGYPLSNGIQIEIGQNDRVLPVKVKKDPRESWGTAYVQVEPTAFSIRLVDSSVTKWFAIGELRTAGRFDELTNRLLTNFHVFFMLGLLTIFVAVVHSEILKSFYGGDRNKIARA